MKANQLVVVMVKVIRWAQAQGIAWTIENPANSRMWDLLGDVLKMEGVTMMTSSFFTRVLVELRNS